MHHQQEKYQWLGCPQGQVAEADGRSEWPLGAAQADRSSPELVEVVAAVGTDTGDQNLGRGYSPPAPPAITAGESRMDVCLACSCHGGEREHK